MDLGQVGKVSEENVTFSLKWRIVNFFSLPGKVDSYCVSPNFNFLNLHWHLKMYPNGHTQFAGKDWISLFLKRSGSGPPKRMFFSFDIRNADGDDEHLYTSKGGHLFSEEKPGWGPNKFLQRSKLLNRKSQLDPSDAVTIVCTMWSHELSTTEDEGLISRETETEDVVNGGSREEDGAYIDIKGGAILRKHFQDLLLDGSDHDVTLKVKDQQFRAHKCILRARSPVFAAMFAHNMTENERGEVCIEDCDPSAFGEFLKYVYVGKVEDMSPNTATSLYYAADKYDFPDLKETCIEFLKVSLTTNVISDVIVLAMKHDEEELLKCAMEFFSKQIMETLITVEWQRFIASNPILSNELTIKAMKISDKNTE